MGRTSDRCQHVVVTHWCEGHLLHGLFRFDVFVNGWSSSSSTVAMTRGRILHVSVLDVISPVGSTSYCFMNSKVSTETVSRSTFGSQTSTPLRKTTKHGNPLSPTIYLENCHIALYTAFLVLSEWSALHCLILNIPYFHAFPILLWWFSPRTWVTKLPWLGHGVISQHEWWQSRNQPPILTFKPFNHVILPSCLIFPMPCPRAGKTSSR